MLKRPFWVRMCLPVIAVLAAVRPAAGATLRLAVDDEAGKAIAFRAQAFRDGRMIAQTWQRGRGELSLPAGKQTLLVRHGFDHDAVRIGRGPGRGR